MRLKCSLLWKSSLWSMQTGSLSKIAPKSKRLESTFRAWETRLESWRTASVSISSSMAKKIWTCRRYSNLPLCSFWSKVREMLQCRRKLKISSCSHPLIKVASCKRIPPQSSKPSTSSTNMQTKSQLRQIKWRSSWKRSSKRLRKPMLVLTRTHITFKLSVYMMEMLRVVTTMPSSKTDSTTNGGNSMTTEWRKSQKRKFSRSRMAGTPGWPPTGWSMLMTNWLNRYNQ